MEKITLERFCELVGCDVSVIEDKPILETLAYVEHIEQTPEICKWIVKQHCFAIQFVRSQTP